MTVCRALLKIHARIHFKFAAFHAHSGSTVLFLNQPSQFVCTGVAHSGSWALEPERLYDEEGLQTTMEANLCCIPVFLPSPYHTYTPSSTLHHTSSPHSTTSSHPHHITQVLTTPLILTTLHSSSPHHSRPHHTPLTCPHHTPALTHPHHTPALTHPHHTPALTHPHHTPLILTTLLGLLTTLLSHSRHTTHILTTLQHSHILTTLHSSSPHSLDSSPHSSHILTTPLTSSPHSSTHILTTLQHSHILTTLQHSHILNTLTHVLTTLQHSHILTTFQHSHILATLHSHPHHTPALTHPHHTPLHSCDADTHYTLTTYRSSHQFMYLQFCSQSQGQLELLCPQCSMYGGQSQDLSLCPASPNPQQGVAQREQETEDLPVEGKRRSSEHTL